MAAVAPRPTPLRIALVAGVVALALSLIGGAHWYIAQRLVLEPGLPEPLRSLALGALVVLGVGAVLQPGLERWLRPPWLRILSFPFLVWMGLFWLSFVALGISDVVLGLMGASGGRDVAGARAAVVGGLVLSVSLLALRNGLACRRCGASRSRSRVGRVRSTASASSRSATSTSGRCSSGRFAAGLTERVNALAPDLVAVTGDLVDGSVEALREEVEPFAALRARHGVFFVTGNHDVYSGGESWVARVRELGMRVLRNERVAIGGAGGFDLAGVDDHRGDWVHGSTEDLDAALAGRDPARALILLAHDPGTFRRAAKRGIDLQLSGHTHGGQIWPFSFVVRIAVPFVAGLHRLGASQLYVSRGSGFWGPPMRLLAPSEITEIVLRRGR